MRPSAHRPLLAGTILGSGLVAGLVAPAAGIAQRIHRNIGANPPAYDSPQYHADGFANRLPSRLLDPDEGAAFLRDWLGKGRGGIPRSAIPTVDPGPLMTAGELAATWLGHATVLLEVAGRWVLTDPVWSDRVSPVRQVGPHRHHPVPVDLDALPQLSAVLISHDHYDHLDTATIERLTVQQSAPFLVPLGVGAHLARWGVPAERIIELDWDDSRQVDGLVIGCHEARHFSGRGPVRRNATLWSSWSVRPVAGGPAVFFGGDTGYSPAFAEIGERSGPFDLTVLPIGAYDRRWPDVHLDPEQAVRAHHDLGGGVLLPIHWATFDLAFHHWAEPPQRLTAAADRSGTRVAVPRPGERITVDRPLPVRDWWTVLGR